MVESEVLREDGGVVKTVTEPGDGPEPEAGARIWIRYRLWTAAGKELDAREFSFRLGKRVVISGLEIVCETMKLKEKCEAVLSPKYAFGSRGFKGEAKGEKVKLEVCLLAMEGGSKDIRQMGARERFELAVEWKTKGNALFKDSKYEKAKIQYEKCLSCLEYLFYKTAESNTKSREAEKATADPATEGAYSKISSDTKRESGMDDAKREKRLGNTDDEKCGSEERQAATPIKQSSEAQEKTDANSESKTSVIESNAGDLSSAQTDSRSSESRGVAKDELKTTPSAEGKEGKEDEGVVEDVPGEKEIRDVRVAALNNLALTKFKLDDFRGTVSHATLSLQTSPSDNYKALYYRGRARVQLGHWDDARKDLVAAAKLAPKNMGIRIELSRLDKKVKQHKAKERRAAAAMFG